MQDPGTSKSRFHNLVANAHRWGWPRALLNVVVKGAALYLGIHVYIVRARQIPPEPEYPDRDQQLTFRKIDTEELIAASRDPTLYMSAGFVERALARGDLAFGAFDGDILVSYIWRSVDSAPDADGVWVRVRKPYNYAYKSFTHFDYRGRHISPTVHLFSDDEMRKLGYRFRTGFVAITNYASISMGKHAGSKKIGYAGYVTWFGQLVTFRSREVRKIGFEFFRPNLLDPTSP